MSEIIANLIARNRALEKRLNYLETQEADSSGDTASNILTKLLTVDGSGSGLDADLLDGYHASAFGLKAAANTWTANNYFGGTLAAGTYTASFVGASGAARDILLAGQAGYSNGFTVQYTGTEMKYSFLGGKVGIGTTSPSYPLQVFGDNPTDGILAEFRNIHGASGNLGVKLSFYNSGVDAFRIGMPDATGDFAFWSSGVNERVRIKSSGNVGIGTASPGTTLDVNGNIKAAAKMYSGYAHTSMGAKGVQTGSIFSQVAAGFPLISIFGEDWNNGGVLAVNAYPTSPKTYTGSYLTDGNMKYFGGHYSTYSRAFMQYFSGNSGTISWYMSEMGLADDAEITWSAMGGFNPTGFGVGLTNPSEKLEVYGNAPAIKITEDSSSNYYLKMQVNYSGADAVNFIGPFGVTFLQFDPTTNYPTTVGAGGSNYVILDGSVAVGQTTVAGGYKLDVNGSAVIRGSIYQPTTSAIHYIGTGGTLRFLDGSSSTNLKVGIGISPAGQFHNYDGTGGTLHITKANFTSELLVANGVGDIAYGATVNYVVRPSTGSIQAGNISIITPLSGYTDWTIFTTGSNTLMLRIYADGSLYAIRTAGSYTYYISLHITYL